MADRETPRLQDAEDIAWLQERADRCVKAMDRQFTDDEAENSVAASVLAHYDRIIARLSLVEAQAAEIATLKESLAKAQQDLAEEISDAAGESGWPVDG